MDIIQNFQVQTKHNIELLKEELGGVRTNRPNTALLENIKVKAYDETLPLKQVASIGIIPPRDISVSVWDANIVTSVVKAIETSELGLAPNLAGNVIMIHLPELTAERREILAKKVKQAVEEYRIKVRRLRDESNKVIQKELDNDLIGEDEKFKLKESIQKKTDGVNEEIEKLLTAKINEINS